MDAGVASVVLLVLGGVCVFIVLLIVAVIFYLLTLYRAMNLVDRRNRTMDPGLVWLSLVPIVNIYWPFHLAIHVPGSLKNEFIDRELDDGSDYGKTLGLVSASLGLVANLISIPMQFIRDEQVILILAGVSMVASLPALVFLILFWIRIAGYKNQLVEDNLRRDDRFDDDDTDSPRRPPPIGGPGTTDFRRASTDDRFAE